MLSSNQLKKFRKIHREKPVLESFFNTVSGPHTYKRLQHRSFPVNFAKIFKNTTSFYRTPLVAACKCENNVNS